LITSKMHVQGATSRWPGATFSLQRNGRRQPILQRSGCLSGNAGDQPRSTKSFVRSTIKRQNVLPGKSRRPAGMCAKVKCGWQGKRRSCRSCKPTTILAQQRQRGTRWTPYATASNSQSSICGRWIPSPFSGVAIRPIECTTGSPSPDHEETTILPALRSPIHPAITTEVRSIERPSQDRSRAMSMVVLGQRELRAARL
jgi:hypothetical protein